MRCCRAEPRVRAPESRSKGEGKDALGVRTLPFPGQLDRDDRPALGRTLDADAAVMDVDQSLRR